MVKVEYPYDLDADNQRIAIYKKRKELAEGNIYSKSRLGLFEQCKHTYRLRHLIKSRISPEEAEDLPKFPDLPMGTWCQIKFLLIRGRKTLGEGGMYVVPETHYEIPEGGYCKWEGSGTGRFFQKFLHENPEKDEYLEECNTKSPNVDVREKNDYCDICQRWIKPVGDRCRICEQGHSGTMTKRWQRKVYGWDRAIWFLNRDLNGNYSIKKEKEDINFPFGSSFHDAMEWFNQQNKKYEIKGRKESPNLDELYNKFRFEWESRWRDFSPCISKPAGYKKNYYDAAGKQWITDIFQNQNEVSTHYIEMPYIIVLSGNKSEDPAYYIQGIFDLIQYGGRRVGIDYKTAKSGVSFWNWFPLIRRMFPKRADRQFAIFKKIIDEINGLFMDGNKPILKWYYTKWEEFIDVKYSTLLPIGEAYKERVLMGMYLLIKNDIEPRKKLLEILERKRMPERKRKYLFPKCGRISCPICTKNPEFASKDSELAL
ncbi:MAG: hypothetical protein CL960_01450 [Euryarchaeota archaeon]|jgi:hypothetical protein|nr:hypothetical protein [Euryarchaeota archaeon]|tara:strand:- start:3943 stop:5394 length:1452 start_codon:yes stop_codon:yes gene_type:complete